jgi:hypothetical protein
MKTVDRDSASSTFAASNFDRNRSRAPLARATLKAMNSPWLWKIGSVCSRTSSDEKPQMSLSVRAE